MSFAPPVMGTTSWSGFYSATVGRPGAGNEVSYDLMPRYGRSSHERIASMMLGKSGFRGIRRVMRALNGVAPGSNATETYARVTAPAAFDDDALGGTRVVETVTVVNANTTAAQQTYLNAKLLDMIYAQAPTSYPIDLSGNGGGNKVGR